LTQPVGSAPRPRGCPVVHPAPKRAQSDERRSAEARLAEAVGLAEAITLEVVRAEVVPLPSISPATLLGSGSVERLAEVIRETNEARPGEPIAVVVVDGTLSPVQQRNLERAWSTKVIDRTGLILEIFGERARTREGELQVELAALSYQRSRLVRSWTHLERQRGGFGFLGGPGETQLEADRRLIGERIARIRRDLAQVRRTRALHRRARRRVPFPVVALVGYTNAGKSTLFNRLTRAEVLARDQLFATLDPTMRGLALPSGQRAILSDTVGFISDLPHELVEAFHATLEEVIEADIVVHVRDAAHPDTEAQAHDVEAVLQGLSAGPESGQRLIEALNKIDLLSEDARSALVNQAPRRATPTVLISAIRGDGCDALLEVLDRELGSSLRVVEVSVPPTDGAEIAWFYRHGQVVEREDGADGVRLKVRLLPQDLNRLERRRTVRLRRPARRQSGR
jgi:GTP-binding protein HflX